MGDGQLLAPAPLAGPARVELIKGKGNTSVASGDRITLLRDADGDGKPEALTPDYALGAHVAALGLAFTTGQGMGEGFREGAFVGQHGSWNRSDLSGYKVVWVPFEGGRPAGQPQDFVTGFLHEGNARGRPVGVLFDPKRSALYVADDLSNTVWRVTPATQTARAQALSR